MFLFKVLFRRLIVSVILKFELQTFLMIHLILRAFFILFIDFILIILCIE